MPIICALPPFNYKGVDFGRTFVEYDTANDVGHNLTELAAASDAFNHNPDENDVVNSFGFSNHSDWFSHLRKYYYAAKVLSRAKPVTWLDVGCGDLQLPWFLNKNRFKPEEGTHYFGIDLRATEGWLTATWNTGPKHRYKADITLIRGDIVRDEFSYVPSWPADGFKVVVCLEVFEHVPRSFAPEFMRRLYQWTQPGGTCLFATPNAGVSASTAENHLDPTTKESREWTFADKCHLAREAGFIIGKCFGTFTGTTYLPETVQNTLKNDPLWGTLKEWLSPGDYNSLISVPHPESSVASLMVLKKP